jgi:2-oxoglutarate dehydrogenase E1 component
MTPKSLLRHPQVVSSLDAFASSSFQRIIPDTANLPPDSVRQIVLCSGKIYYELAQRREELKRSDVAIIRIEQLYPLHRDDLRAVLASYREGTPVVWVQEEPENMAAWRHLRARFGETLVGRFPLKFISRPASASPATGSLSSHKREQERILSEAFIITPHAN